MINTRYSLFGGGSQYYPFWGNTENLLYKKVQGYTSYASPYKTVYQ